MISSLDNSNISNNHNSNNEYNLTSNNKNNSILINNLNGTGEKEKDKAYNTINDFYSNLKKNNDISNQNENNLLNKTLKISNKNMLENNSNENNSNNLSSLIKDINFNNLNEYYELQSSIFMKKIQKLNLKFYWTSEVLLNEKNIQYPYNKLFLILFKEISLYIDEIERLNKQLKLKAKNENYYTQKISQLTQKEKNNMINKQMLKNMQRNYNLLQKANDKYKNNIEKLNKKINYYTNTSKINKNINYNECKSFFGNQTMINTTLDSFNTRNSINYNSTKNIYNKGLLMPKKSKKKNIEIKEIIKSGIEQCNEEIKNLSKIEELLLVKYRNKGGKIRTRYNSRNKVKFKLYKTIK
jgi:hypothetical protein